MKFTKITYGGTGKVAHGVDDTGAPITKEFPYSMSDSEIFALGDKTADDRWQTTESLPTADCQLPTANPNAKTKK